MTDQVLDILKLALLGLLYLFFVRVLWAVWSEVKAPAAANASPRRSAGRAGGDAPGRATRSARAVPSRLRILEPVDQHGKTYAIGNVISIGRDVEQPGIQITGDTYVSGLHARLTRTDIGVVIDDLGSRNGTFLNGTRLHDQRTVRVGDRIQIGFTVLEAE